MPPEYKISASELTLHRE